MSPEATRFLERLVRSADRAPGQRSQHGTDASGAEAKPSASLDYMEGAVGALLAVGDLSADEAAAWLQRARDLHWRRMDITPWRTLQPVGGSEASARRIVGSFDPRSSRLLGAIPGPTESRPWRGGRLRVVSIDVYEAGLVVHWQADEPPVLTEEEIAECERGLIVWAEPFRSVHRRRRLLELGGPVHVSAYDDKGHEYHRGISRTTEGDGPQRGTNSFTPGLRAEANRLVLQFDDASFDVDVN